MGLHPKGCKGHVRVWQGGCPFHAVCTRVAIFMRKVFEKMGKNCYSNISNVIQLTPILYMSIQLTCK